MLTRDARRYRGSLPALVSSTASMPSAAAQRKIAPRLVGFMTFSSTAMRRAPAQTSSNVGRGGRRMAHSIPRVRWKPVSCVSTSSGAVYTGISGSQRVSISAPLPVMCCGSIRNETGTHPASSARPITSGLSAINRALDGSARFTSWFSVARAYTSSSGARKSVISMTWGISSSPPAVLRGRRGSRRRRGLWRPERTRRRD